MAYVAIPHVTRNGRITIGSLSLPAAGPYIDMPTYLAELGYSPDSNSANAGTDVSTAINAAFEAAPANQNYTYWFGTTPAGLGWRLASPLRPKRAHTLISPGHHHSGGGCTFFCDMNATVRSSGLIVDSVESGGVGISAQGLTAKGLRFKSLDPTNMLRNTFYAVNQIRRHHNSNGFSYIVTIAGTTANVDQYDPAWIAAWPTTPGATHVDGTVTWQCLAKVHGVDVKTKCHLFGLHFDGFPGSGIYTDCNFSEGNNANGWHYQDCLAQNCVSYGFWWSGGDAQAGESERLNAQFCAEGGLYDDADVGNKHITPTVEFCGSGQDVGFEHTHAVSLTGDNGAGVCDGLYVEASGKLHVAGKWYLSQYQGLTATGFTGESGQAIIYGRDIRPYVKVINETRSGESWELDLNGGYGSAANPTAWGMRQLGGVNDHHSFRRVQTGSATQHAMWWHRHHNLGDDLFGVRGSERGMPSAFLVNRELQLGDDSSAVKGIILRDPARKSGGRPLWGEALYLRTAANFTPGGPSFEHGRSPTNASGASAGGMCFARWVANTAYTVGQMISDSNGRIQRCTTAGTSAAVTEPTWATTHGSTTADGAGTLVWTAGIAAGTTVAGVVVAAYTASTAYDAGKLIVPAARDGFIYRIDYGVSDSGAGTPGYSGNLGEQLTHGTPVLSGGLYTGGFYYRRWGFDLAAVLWYAGANTSGTPV